ncbi:unnamed protein product, partial [Linum tenue]
IIQPLLASSLRNPTRPTALTTERRQQQLLPPLLPLDPLAVRQQSRSPSSLPPAVSPARHPPAVSPARRSRSSRLHTSSSPDDGSDQKPFSSPSAISPTLRLGVRRPPPPLSSDQRDPRLLTRFDSWRIQKLSMIMIVWW